MGWKFRSTLIYTKGISVWPGGPTGTEYPWFGLVHIRCVAHLHFAGMLIDYTERLHQVAKWLRSNAASNNRLLKTCQDGE